MNHKSLRMPWEKDHLLCCFSYVAEVFSDESNQVLFAKAVALKLFVVTAFLEELHYKLKPMQFGYFYAYAIA